MADKELHEIGVKCACCGRETSLLKAIEGDPFSWIPSGSVEGFNEICGECADKYYVYVEDEDMYMRKMS